MDKKKDSEKILKLVGGKDNVNSLVHCATRLRFVLKDESKANDEKLSEMNSVLKVVKSGGQYQVVIGPDVSDFYDEIVPELNSEKDNSTESNQKKKISITGIISGAFSPLIPIMAGAGMVKALLTVLTTLGWLSDKSTLYLVLSSAGNSVFYFLPIFLGATLAKQFNADQFVGAAIGAALLEPSFMGLIGKKGLTLFGLGLNPVNYSATVFPIFVIVAAYALLNKYLKKIVPQSLQLFINPMISLLILVPMTVLIFGPFGNVVGDAISALIMQLFSFNRMIAGAVLGAVYPFLTIMGLHWGFTPVTLQNLSQFGGDIVEGVNVAAVWAQIGIAIGIFLRSRKGTNDRTVSGSTAITGIFAGVTEPILYGLIMGSKRLMIIVAIAGGIGGAINGFFHVMMTSYVFHNIFSIFMLSYSPILFMVLGSSASLIVGILLTVFWKDNKDSAKSKTDDNAQEQVSELSDSRKKIDLKGEKVTLNSPLSGKVVALSEIKDDVFSSGSVGSGIGIVPDKGLVTAPFDGEVIALFPTKHAIGLRSAQGIEVLIHLGLETVNLNGEGFEQLVELGSKVNRGQNLLNFDLEKLTSLGYDITSPVLITNSDKYKVELLAQPGSKVDSNDVIIEIKN